MKVLVSLAWMRFSEQPKKTLYLIVTLVAGILTWIVLSSLASPYLLSKSGDVTKAYLILEDARAELGRFPSRHIPRIRQIPGVAALTWFNATAFGCADNSMVSVLGFGGDIDDQVRKLGISDTDLVVWHATERGILAGPETARRCGLTPGTLISPKNMDGNGEIPLQVVALFPERGGIADRTIYGHYDYVNRLMRTDKQDKIIRAIVRVDDLALLDQVANAIEHEFQSSDPPLAATVVSEASALGRFGQVQGLLLLIMGGMVLCVLLVFCATLAHLTAQRRTSMAILQTLGFSARIQGVALLLELTGIAVLGTLFGIAAGYGLLALLSPWLSQLLHSPALHPVKGALLVLLPAILLLLTLTQTWPLRQIARLRPMDHLRL